MFDPISHAGALAAAPDPMTSDAAAAAARLHDPAAGRVPVTPAGAAVREACVGSQPADAAATGRSAKGRQRPAWLSFAASLAVAAAGLASLPRMPAAREDAMPVTVSAALAQEPVASGLRHEADQVDISPAKAVPAALPAAEARTSPAGSPEIAPSQASEPAVPVGAGSGPAAAESAVSVRAKPGAPAADSARGLEALPPTATGAGVKPAASRTRRPVRAARHEGGGLVPVQHRQCGHLGFVGRGFCEQRVRLAYCSGRYGRVADCPLPSVVTPN